MRPILAILAVLSLAACSSWLGEPEKPPLPGERMPVLSLESKHEPDESLRDVAVVLPRPRANADWPQAGGDPSHAMHHLALGEPLGILWRRSIGEGSTDQQFLLSSPVAGDGRLYVTDAEYRIAALAPATGEVIWRQQLEIDDEGDSAFGGGIAYADGRLYVTTGYALVVALDAANGKEIWRQSVQAPVRSPPTVSGGRVFTVTVENKLHVLDARDGKPQWSHSGLTEIAGMLGGASPAVQGDTVVVPYSSGELVALRVENGRRIWADSLVSVQSGDPVSTIADIRARPVIDRDLVVAIGNGGRMAAIATRTGARVWQRALGGIEMPWVAGDYVYVVTGGAELLCLRRLDGRIRWVLPLPRWEDEKDRTDPITWAGPVLAGDRLILGSSTGEVVAVSPYTGALLGRIKLSDPVSIAPVVAGETLYILTDDADLFALR